MKKYILNILIFINIIYFCCFQIKDLNSSKQKYKYYTDNLECNNYFKNIINYYEIYIYIILISTILAIFSNNNLFKLITCLLYSSIILIIYNPMVKENKIISENKYGVRNEFIINIIILLGILTSTLKIDSSNNKNDKNDKIINN